MTTKKPTPKPTIAPTTDPTPIVLPPQDPSNVLGIEGTPGTNFAGIPWVRLPYPSCGSSNLSGQVLKDTLQSYHKQGIRVLVTMCQSSGGKVNCNNAFNDVAQSHPDAIQ